MKTVTSLAACTMIVFLSTRLASADTQISNLQQPYSANFGIGSGVASGEGAMQFFTGSLAPVWDLNSVTLLFGGPVQWGTRDNGPILYSAYIFNGSSNAPASQLAFLGSFNFTNQTANSLEVTFTPSTTVPLSSNSDYWIVVGAVTTCPNGILAGTGSHYNQVSGTGWQYGEFGYLFNGDSFLGSPGPSTGFLEIQASPESVPEPSCLALAAIALAATFSRCWKRYKPSETEEAAHTIAQPRWSPQPPHLQMRG